MRRLLRRGLATGIFTVLCAGPAHGDSFVLYENYCAIGSFRNCASVSVRTFLRPDGLTTLIIRVRNLQGSHPLDNSRGLIINEVWAHFSELGDTTSPGRNSAEDVGVRAVGRVGQIRGGGGNTGDFEVGPEGVIFQNLEPTDGILGCDVVTPDPNRFSEPLTAWRTCPRLGLTGWVEFTITPAIPVPWEATDARITLIYEDLTGHGNGGCGLLPSECFLPTTPVPEPVTLSLLGTGLVGLGLAHRRRKFKGR